MAIQSSFPKVADQVISFNKNIVDIPLGFIGPGVVGTGI